MTEAAAIGLLELRERKKVLDAAWLTMLGILLVSVLLPWFLRILDVNANPLAWSVFGYGVAYLLLSSWAERMETVHSLRAALLGLQALNVVFLAALWLMVGGTQVPIFLLAFVVPVVVGGLVLTRWEPFALTGWCLLVVGTTALATSSGLRWYFERIGLPGGGLLAALGDRLPLRASPFPAADTQPAHTAVTLILFAALLPAVAGATATLSGVMRQLQRRLETSQRARAEAESLADKVLESSRDPAALVHTASRRVVVASRSFLRQLLIEPEDLVSRDFFKLARFSFPEVVEDIMEGGEVPYAVYRVGEEARVARVTVAPIEHEGSRFSYVTLQDVTDVSHLKRALDALGPMYVLTDMDGRVVYFNAGAAERFERLGTGSKLEHALEGPDMPAGWWDPGPRRRAERSIKIGGIPHHVQIVTAEVPGEEGRISLVSMNPQDGNA